VENQMALTNFLKGWRLIPLLSFWFLLGLASGQSYEPCTDPSEIITIPDPLIERAVRALAGVKVEGPDYFTSLMQLRFQGEKIEPYQGSITCSVMQSLTVVSIGEEGITSLEGLQHATNLKAILFSVWGTERYHSLSDLSPISSLVSLEELSIQNSNISDLSTLAKLTNLRFLDVGNNPVTDISPLTNLSNLTNLTMGSLPVTDIMGLEHLQKLEILFMCCTKVSDFSVVQSLQSLSYLDMQFNRPNDISFLPNSSLAGIDLSCTGLDTREGTKDRAIIDEMISRGVQVKYDEPEDLDTLDCSFGLQLLN
jgi:Leucine Rich repeats (2 copies)